MNPPADISKEHSSQLCRHAISQINYGFVHDDTCAFLEGLDCLETVVRQLIKTAEQKCAAPASPDAPSELTFGLDASDNTIQLSRKGNPTKLLAQLRLKPKDGVWRLCYVNLSVFGLNVSEMQEIVSKLNELNARAVRAKKRRS